jgi:hypothetical protein
MTEVWTAPTAGCLARLYMLAREGLNPAATFILLSGCVPARPNACKTRGLAITDPAVRKRSAAPSRHDSGWV